jgi:hypothetical protein
VRIPNGQHLDFASADGRHLVGHSVGAARISLPTSLDAPPPLASHEASAALSFFSGFGTALPVDPRGGSLTVAGLADGMAGPQLRCLGPIEQVLTVARGDDRARLAWHDAVSAVGKVGVKHVRLHDPARAAGDLWMRWSGLLLRWCRRAVGEIGLTASKMESKIRSNANWPRGVQPEMQPQTRLRLQWDTSNHLSCT